MHLNHDQTHALEQVLQGKNIFLTGSAGTGKSFLLRAILEAFDQRKRKYALTALTGCAALLLGKGAATLHSWAGIGLGKEPTSKIVSAIRKNTKTMRRWLLTQTLIVDEVSMMPPELFEKLDAVAKIVRNSQKPMGGIQVIFVGDFFQLPPVVKQEGDEPVEEQQFIFETDLWKQYDFQNVILQEIMRQKDPVFQKILEEARKGKLTKESFQILKSRQNLEWQSFEIKPTLLFPLRSVVTQINQENLRSLKGLKHTYRAKTVFGPSAKAVELKEEDPVVKYAIIKMDRDGGYDPELVLAVGAQVMLTINLDVENGLVNGSRGIVTGFADDPLNLPLVKFIGHSESIPIQCHEYELEEPCQNIYRRQIPLILAYALTIHKSQGATLDSALIDIGPNIFEYGQAYVALSRAKNLDCLYLWDVEPYSFKANQKVVNFYESLTPLVK